MSTVWMRLNSPGRSAWLLPGALALLAAACSPPPAPVAPPPEVVFGVVQQREVPVERDLVGQTAGSQDVEIRARVEGYIETVDFREGTLVAKGDLLYRIDPKPFEAAVAGARARLAQAEARRSKAQQDVDRFTPLAEMQAISQQELDNAVSSLNAASAECDAMQARLDRDLLDLGYTRITAPIDGLIDVTRVKTGNLVGRNESTLLTTISVVDPLQVDCSITESEYLDFVRRNGAQDFATTEKRPARARLFLADGSEHTDLGLVTAIERSVNANTGSLRMQFTFPNPMRLLRPGQFARVRVVSDTLPAALLVPQRAVQELQGQFSVAVVGADDVVTLQRVTPGPRIGGEWVLLDGVKAGDRVVVEGLQRVRNGVKVTPKAAAGPAAADAAAVPAAPTGSR